LSNTLAKPKGLGPEYAAQFDDASVVAAYQHRPPHPDETIRILAGLIAKDCRRVLDVGCGTGFVARPMSLLVERVDALDCSARMIERGQSLLPVAGFRDREVGRSEQRMDAIAVPLLVFDQKYVFGHRIVGFRREMRSDDKASPPKNQSGTVLFARRGVRSGRRECWLWPREDGTEEGEGARATI